MNYIKKISVIFTRLFQYFIIFCIFMVGINFLYNTISLKIDNFYKVSEYKKDLETQVGDKKKVRYYSQEIYDCSDNSGNQFEPVQYCNIYVFYDKTSKKKIYIIEEKDGNSNYYDEDNLPKDEEE